MMDAIPHLTKADYDLLATFRAPRQFPHPDDPESTDGIRTQRFIDEKLIGVYSYKPVIMGYQMPDLWKVTIEGEDALAEYERTNHEKAEEKTTEERHYRVQILVDILCALGGAVLGVLGTLLIQRLS